MKLFELQQLQFLHGSDTALPLRQPLTANTVSKHAYRANSMLAKLAEEYKPSDQPSRMQCWFLCDSLEQLKMSTGSMKHVYVVQPITPVFKHWYGWFSIAEAAIKTRASELWRADGMANPIQSYTSSALQDQKVKQSVEQALQNYWNGVELSQQVIAQSSMSLQRLYLIEYTTETISVVSKHKK